MQPGETLRDDQGLDYAIHLKQNVIVYQQGKILDYGGRIESYSDNSVTINGARYLKSSCEFRIR